MMDSAISCGVRAPMSTPAGVWTRRRSSPVRPMPSRTPAPRVRLATSATNSTPASKAARIAASSPLPRLATTTAVAWSHVSDERSTSKSMNSASVATASLIGVAPTSRSTGAGSIGRRKISTAPPERHGFTTTSAPGVSGKSAELSGSTRSSRVRPLRSVSSAAARTEFSAQTPPTKPSMEPSERMTAASPGCADVGSCARTTVACTNGVRCRVSVCARSAIVLTNASNTSTDDRLRWVAAARRAWRPTPATA